MLSLSLTASIQFANRRAPYGRCSQLLALQALIQTSKAFESATLQESANPARPITRQKSGSAATFTGPIHSPPTSYALSNPRLQTTHYTATRQNSTPLIFATATTSPTYHSYQTSRP